ncbi:MAG: hypothetical protein ISR90_07060 [Candidatus Marinimicrobia bacterium]|nr:hypothetical protein [Candidatus Neomarinimicrobiota bacterium]
MHRRIESYWPTVNLKRDIIFFIIGIFVGIKAPIEILLVTVSIVTTLYSLLSFFHYFDMDRSGDVFFNITIPSVSFNIGIVVGAGIWVVGWDKGYLMPFFTWLGTPM